MLSFLKNTFPLEKSMMFILSLVKNAPENESQAEQNKISREQRLERLPGNCSLL